jgi:hypothetical protein
MNVGDNKIALIGVKATSRGELTVNGPMLLREGAEVAIYGGMRVGCGMKL